MQKCGFLLKKNEKVLSKQVLWESRAIGSLFMSGGRRSFVSGQQCLPECGEGIQENIIGRGGSQLRAAWSMTLIRMTW